MKRLHLALLMSYSEGFRQLGIESGSVAVTEGR